MELEKVKKTITKMWCLMGDEWMAPSLLNDTYKDYYVHVPCHIETKSCCDTPGRAYNRTKFKCISCRKEVPKIIRLAARLQYLGG